MGNVNRSSSILIHGAYRPGASDQAQIAVFFRSMVKLNKSARFRSRISDASARPVDVVGVLVIRAGHFSKSVWF
jgi:hypothetical protein